MVLFGQSRSRKKLAGRLDVLFEYVTSQHGARNFADKIATKVLLNRIVFFFTFFVFYSTTVPRIFLNLGYTIYNY